MRLEACDFDLRRDVVESVVEQMAEIAAAKSIELTYVTSTALDPPLLVGDAFRCRQIITNLICALRPPSMPREPPHSRGSLCCGCRVAS